MGVQTIEVQPKECSEKNIVHYGSADNRGAMVPYIIHGYSKVHRLDHRSGVLLHEAPLRRPFTFKKKL